ncbi:MAG: hypothetical protein LBT65_09630, partial [Synergistaceae bacterium]|nr:hypothetical protein [Synergistaceae bacterium]
MRTVKVRLNMICALCVCVLCGGLLWLVGARESAATPPSAFRTFLKETTYPLEDAILTGVEPNVLFYIDTTVRMTMSMKGQKPIFTATDSWMQTNYPYMRDADYRAALLREDTFGVGGRSASQGTLANQTARLENNNLTLPFVPIHLGTEAGDDVFVNVGEPVNSNRRRFTRWGRDVDASNNIIGDPNCYYSLDPTKPYMLTFRDSASAAWSGTGARPGSFPSALVPYLPGGGQAGQPVPVDLANLHLVPNDSKMYTVKLVLARLLDPENGEMLSKLRLGLATTFSDRKYIDNASYIYSAGMKHTPFRYSEAGGVSNFYQGGTDSFYAYHNGALRWTHFPWGTAPQPSGLLSNEYGHSVALYGSVSGYNGTAGERHASRSIFRVPFDFMYKLNEHGTYNPTASLIAFRELIDGVEQVDRTDGLTPVARFVNDELFCTGYYYSTEWQIYGRDNWFTNNGVNLDVLNGYKAVTYARGVHNSRSMHDSNVPARGGVPMKRLRNIEGLMTGTALGDVLDFFTPMNSSILAFTENSSEADDTRGYFPVTGSCQPNWIIFFTTGNETEINVMRDHLKKIYLNSKTMRGRYWNGAKWLERTYEMDNPIRTIFVGLISTEDMEHDGDPYAADSASDLPAKRVRKAIRRMAHAGQ